MPKKTPWHRKNIVGLPRISERAMLFGANSEAGQQADGYSIDFYSQGPGVDNPTPSQTGSDIVPTGLRVVKQVVNTDEYGFQYVDVTFEWDEVPGVLQEYNLRVAETNDD